MPGRERPRRTDARGWLCARTLRAPQLRHRRDPRRGGVMDFDIPDELALLARTVRDFVETRLQPIEKQVEDSDEIPDEIIREMAGLGFFGLPFPEEYGGAGAGDLRAEERRVGN